MDNQRLFLGIALVFVLFLIWQAWIEEQTVARRPAQTQTMEGRPADTPPAAPAEDVPSARPAEAPPSEPDTPSGERIRVVTDQF